MRNFTISPKSLITAGKSTFTVQSPKTGARFTYKVTQPKGKPHFVSVMTGSDNESSFTFAGTIFDSKKFVPSRKSPLVNSPSVQAFNWIWENVDNLPESLTILNSEKCCCCGRKLTTPESIERGIGPECLKNRG